MLADECVGAANQIELNKVKPANTDKKSIIVLKTMGVEIIIRIHQRLLVLLSWLRKASRNRAVKARLHAKTVAADSGKTMQTPLGHFSHALSRVILHLSMATGGRGS